MTARSDPPELLRAHGLRVTPQRRAILDAFTNDPAEHLSADEVHARAAASVPEIGRGTVYATLAELTELGLLAARGSPEPVRYETNTAPHQHFRCRLCLRRFDVDIPEIATRGLAAAGFVVEGVTVTAEGICAECVDYDRGLRTGARRARSRPSPNLPTGFAAARADSTVGPLTFAATSEGVVRVVFEDHADVPALQDAIRARRGGRAARAHVDAAKAWVAAYFAGDPPTDCAIDWRALDGAETLQAAMGAPRGEDLPYDLLDTGAPAEKRGQILGSNPVAILVPCHRVTRGREIAADYVGGPERRRILRELERA